MALKSSITKNESASNTKVAAQVGTSPAEMSAVAALRFANIVGEQDPNDLIAEIKKRIAAVNKNDMSGVEAMLISQAVALQSIFANLANRAALNAGEHLRAFETYMKLALRAQSQSRATLETLSAIKNPPVVYAKQANLTTGPQQVNNYSRTQENEIERTQVSEEAHELLPDARAPSLEGGNDQTLETLGEVHRAKKPRR